MLSLAAVFWVWRLATPDPRHFEPEPGNIPRIGTDGANVSLDWHVLGFTLALSILTGVLFSVVPALHSSRGFERHAEGEQQSRWHGCATQEALALVTTEMALALVLLIRATLLMRTFIAIRCESRLRCA
jgi:hypothetical protein